MKIAKKIIYLTLFSFVNSYLSLNGVCFIQAPNSPYSPDPTMTSISSVGFTPEVSGKIFAGVPSTANATLYIFDVNTSTGEFTLVDSALTGLGPVSVAITQESTNNVFVATADSGGPSVSVYQVNMTNGQLTPVQTVVTPFAGTAYIAFSPNIGGNLFAAVTYGGSSNQVTIYRVNPTTGIFTLVNSFGTGSFPSAVAFSPNISGNLFVAVSNATSNNLSVFSVDTSTGNLTLIQNPTTGTFPFGIAYTQTSTGNVFAAAANALLSGSTSNVSVYSVDTTTGLFTQVPGSPFAAGVDPTSVAFTQDENGNTLAAVTNAAITSPGNESVSIYMVNPTSGVFTEVPGSPFARATTQYFVALTPALSTGNVFAGIGNFTASTVSSNLFVIGNPVLNTATSDCSGIVSVTGTGLTNAAISIFADGLSNIGNGSADSSGNFNFNSATPLSDGSHSISVIQTSNSCTSSPSFPISVTVVTTPSAPTLSTASVDCDGNVTIAGSGARANAAITVFADGTNIGNGAANVSGNFDFTITPSPLLSNGTHEITVTQTDSSCESSSSNAITVNVEPCSTIVITSPKSGTTTTNTLQPISGTAPANVGITVFAILNSTQFVLGRTTSNAAGDWTVIPNSPLAPGTYTIFAALTSDTTTQSNRIILTVIGLPNFDILSEAIFNKYGCNL